MTPADLRTDALHHRFGARPVLAGIDLHVHGGLVALLGANGAGKTTLLRCLATVLRPTAGTVTIDRLDPRHEAQRIQARRRLGYLPQDLGFATRANVFDTIDHVAVMKGFVDDRARRHLVFDAVEQVGLRDRIADPVGELSSGMRQRLGLAQALLGTPTLLLLDEPAAGLDPDERQRVRSLLAERRHAATAVISTHLIDEAAECDRVAVLHDGSIVFHDTPSRLAALANGSVWMQREAPTVAVRATWRQPDGSHRCLGTPPPGATITPPRVEDGYLLLTAVQRRRLE